MKEEMELLNREEIKSTVDDVETVLIEEWEVEEKCLDGRIVALHTNRATGQTMVTDTRCPEDTIYLLDSSRLRPVEDCHTVFEADQIVVHDLNQRPDSREFYNLENYPVNPNGFHNLLFVGNSKEYPKFLDEVKEEWKMNSWPTKLLCVISIVALLSLLIYVVWNVFKELFLG